MSVTLGTQGRNQGFEVSKTSSCTVKTPEVGTFKLLITRENHKHCTIDYKSHTYIVYYGIYIILLYMLHLLSSYIYIYTYYIYTISIPYHINILELPT